MNRFRSIDWLGRIRNRGLRLTADILFGVACTGLMIGARALIDQWLPSSGPFALIYPAIMIATLFGQLPGGFTAYVLCLLWAWYFVLPPHGSFVLSSAEETGRLIVNAGSGFVVLMLSNFFRRAVTHKQRVLIEEIDRRATLLQEVNHRTRNNFALVISLLQLQRREAVDPPHVADLDKAISRVHSFAGAYALLADDDYPDVEVDIAEYLDTLTSQLLPALLPPSVVVDSSFESYPMPRDQAVGVGLTLNEAITNAAKYAFGADGNGSLDLRFEVDEGHWCLTVQDRGGSGASMGKSAGIGTGLMAAFAKQAGGRIERKVVGGGMRVALSGPA